MPEMRQKLQGLMQKTLENNPKRIQSWVHTRTHFFLFSYLVITHYFLSSFNWVNYTRYTAHYHCYPVSGRCVTARINIRIIMSNRHNQTNDSDLSAQDNTGHISSGNTEGEDLGQNTESTGVDSNNIQNGSVFQ